MKRGIALFVFIMSMFTLVGCAKTSVTVIGGADGPTEVYVAKEEETVSMYTQITPQEAKEIMDTQSGFVILDVREQDEYDDGHIEGAVLMPYTQTEELAPELLPDKNQQILVYCRSGRRSKIAAQTLADLGYTDVLEFGGIIDWPYEVVQ